MHWGRTLKCTAPDGGEHVLPWGSGRGATCAMAAAVLHPSHPPLCTRSCIGCCSLCCGSSPAAGLAFGLGLGAGAHTVGGGPHDDDDEEEAAADIRHTGVMGEAGAKPPSRGDGGGSSRRALLNGGAGSSTHASGDGGGCSKSSTHAGGDGGGRTKSSATVISGVSPLHLSAIRQTTGITAEDLVCVCGGGGWQKAVRVIPCRC